MAITQISRIQHRRGLQENLPNLASGELGWAVDTRKLYIGNGTTDEGSPASGVTEILTQYSGVGTVSSQAPRSVTLPYNQNSVPTGLVLNKNTTNAATVQYIIERNGIIRRGRFDVGFYSNISSNNIVSNEMFTESANIGVTLRFSLDSSNNAIMTYTTTASPAIAANLTYAVSSEFQLKQL